MFLVEGNFNYLSLKNLPSHGLLTLFESDLHLHFTKTGTNLQTIHHRRLATNDIPYKDRKKKLWFWSTDFLKLVRWPGRLFFEPQPKFSKSKECQHSEMDADAELAIGGVRCWMSVAGSRLTALQERRKWCVGEAT